MIQKGPFVLVSQAIPLSKDISVEDSERLTREAMEDEIWQVVSQIHPLKTPGLDGTHVVLQQKRWPYSQ